MIIHFLYLRMYITLSLPIYSRYPYTQSRPLWAFQTLKAFHNNVSKSTSIALLLLYQHASYLNKNFVIKYIHKSSSTHSNPIHQYIFMIHQTRKFTNGYSCLIYSSPTLFDDENELKMFVCKWLKEVNRSLFSNVRFRCDIGWWEWVENICLKVIERGKQKSDE